MFKKLITSATFGSLLITSPFTVQLETSAATITDTVPAGGSIAFIFTENNKPSKVNYKVQKTIPNRIDSPLGDPIDANGLYEDTNKRGLSVDYNFVSPSGATDFNQEIKDASGKITKVAAGNIKKGSPWSFFPLDELPNISWRIPDLASISPIYTQVNLDIYLSSNPNGFLDGNWSIGQTLNDLGITIINGQIPGIKGIYFATTELTFDPDSENGWVPAGGNSTYLNSTDFQAKNGNIEIISEHKSVSQVPEPFTIVGTLIGGTAAFCMRKKLKMKSDR
jgi:hypothetical protein